MLSLEERKDCLAQGLVFILLQKSVKKNKKMLHWVLLLPTVQTRRRQVVYVYSGDGVSGKHSGAAGEHPCFVSKMPLISIRSEPWGALRTFNVLTVSRCLTEGRSPGQKELMEQRWIWEFIFKSPNRFGRGLS